MGQYPLKIDCVKLKDAYCKATTEKQQNKTQRGTANKTIKEIKWNQKYSVQRIQKKRKKGKSLSLKQDQICSVGWLLLLPTPRAVREKMAYISFYSKDW